MKKSVYSLVLMDDVVKAVDNEAYRLGTSRSNLINQILAEHLSCITPEMRMRKIFSSLEELVSGTFQVQQQRSASLMTIKTALDYKYRPTISYKVELERIPDNILGTLKVQIRTQNSALTELFNSFFVYRGKLEAAVSTRFGRNDYGCELVSGCFVRRLLRNGSDSENAGEAISRYLDNLNKSIQIYFSSPQDFSVYAPKLEAEYERMLDDHMI